MSISPRPGTSTIFGLLFVASFTLSALAFVIAMVAMLADREPMADVVAPLHFHDLGKTAAGPGHAVGVFLTIRNS